MPVGFPAVCCRDQSNVGFLLVVVFVLDRLPLCSPRAAATLARDEDAMQHRLQKVISSYSFSSATLNQLDEDQFNDNPWQEQDEEEQQELHQEQQLQLQPNGSSPGNGSTLAQPQQQRVMRRQS